MPPCIPRTWPANSPTSVLMTTASDSIGLLMSQVRAAESGLRVSRQSLQTQLDAARDLMTKFDQQTDVMFFHDGFESVDGAAFEVQWFSDAPLTVLVGSCTVTESQIDTPAGSAASNIGSECAPSAPASKAPGPIRLPEWRIFNQQWLKSLQMTHGIRFHAYFHGCQREDQLVA